MFRMKRIPEGKTRGWKVDIEKNDVGEIARLSLSSQFGTVTYGLRPEGYDGWVFREVGGGGSATLFFSVDPEGTLLIGLLQENRSNMGKEPVWCIAGGFVDPGETHKQTQLREASEETAVAGEKTDFLLPGRHTNCNRAFFVADAENEDAHLYAREIPFEELETDGLSWKLRADSALTSNIKKSDALRFLGWRTAVRVTADALARSAIAQLLSTRD